MLFSALEQAEAEAIRHRGSMFWREQEGSRYLISLLAHSRQRSLGPASPKNELKYERFTKRKIEAEARLKSLREKAEEYKRMNKALRVGRTPDILIEVLNATSVGLCPDQAPAFQRYESRPAQESQGPGPGGRGGEAGSGVPASPGQGRPKQSGAYRETMKLVAGNRCGSSTKLASQSGSSPWPWRCITLATLVMSRSSTSHSSLRVDGGSGPP